jgi:5-dehydro-2-deoxygluconokinase
MNGGRSCINCSGIWASRHTEAIADAIAKKLGPIAPLPTTDPNAAIAAFTTAGVAEAMNNQIEDGIKGPGFPVEVYNVLGAGDAFMSGFLRGWLRDEPISTCCAYANAGGAFAVSRLLCSAEYPTFEEMQYFITKGAASRVVRHDAALNHLHWSTTRDSMTSYPKADHVYALAIDHRSQLEDIADKAGASRERIKDFKRLAVEAAAQVAKGRDGFGILLDGTYGREALFRAADHNFWIGRPVELPGSRPLDLE